MCTVRACAHLLCLRTYMFDIFVCGLQAQAVGFGLSERNKNEGAENDSKKIEEEKIVLASETQEVMSEAEQGLNGRLHSITKETQDLVGVTHRVCLRMFEVASKIGSILSGLRGSFLASLPKRMEQPGKNPTKKYFLTFRPPKVINKDARSRGQARTKPRKEVRWSARDGNIGGDLGSKQSRYAILAKALESKKMSLKSESERLRRRRIGTILITVLTPNSSFDFECPPKNTTVLQIKKLAMGSNVDSVYETFGLLWGSTPLQDVALLSQSGILTDVTFKLLPRFRAGTLGTIDGDQPMPDALSSSSTASQQPEQVHASVETAAAGGGGGGGMGEVPGVIGGGAGTVDRVQPNTDEWSSSSTGRQQHEQVHVETAAAGGGGRGGMGEVSGVIGGGAAGGNKELVYTVLEAGETLDSIAIKFTLSADALKERNRVDFKKTQTTRLNKQKHQKTEQVHFRCGTPLSKGDTIKYHPEQDKCYGSLHTYSKEQWYDWYCQVHASLVHAQHHIVQLSASHATEQKESADKLKFANQRICELEVSQHDVKSYKSVSETLFASRTRQALTTGGPKPALGEVQTLVVSDRQDVQALRDECRPLMNHLNRLCKYCLGVSCIEALIICAPTVLDSRVQNKPNKKSGNSLEHQTLWKAILEWAPGLEGLDAVLNSSSHPHLASRLFRALQRSICRPRSDTILLMIANGISTKDGQAFLNGTRCGLDGRQRSQPRLHNSQCHAELHNSVKKTFIEHLHITQIGEKGAGAHLPSAAEFMFQTYLAQNDVLAALVEELLDKSVGTMVSKRLDAVGRPIVEDGMERMTRMTQFDREDVFRKQIVEHDKTADVKTMLKGLEKTWRTLCFSVAGVLHILIDGVKCNVGPISKHTTTCAGMVAWHKLEKRIFDEIAAAEELKNLTGHKLVQVLSDHHRKIAMVQIQRSSAKRMQGYRFRKLMHFAKASYMKRFAEKVVHDLKPAQINPRTGQVLTDHFWEHLEWAWELTSGKNSEGRAEQRYGRCHSVHGKCVGHQRCGFCARIHDHLQYVPLLTIGKNDGPKEMQDYFTIPYGAQIKALCGSKPDEDGNPPGLHVHWVGDSKEQFVKGEPLNINMLSVKEGRSRTLAGQRPVGFLRLDLCMRTDMKGNLSI